MRKQYAVFGLGNFGKHLALGLENLGCEVIVVDNSMEKIQEIADKVSYAMCANIEDPEVIKSLGARNLDGAVIAISENFGTSIMATIMAKEIGIPYVLAKAQSSLHATVLKIVGAVAVVHPDKEMGRRIASTMVSGNFADWIELSPDYSLVETEIPDEWVGKRLVDLQIREKYGINVVGTIENGVVDVTINPQRPFHKNLIVILIGSNEALQKLKKE
ncbi:MAG: potassium channel family protein [[Clostridium] nexile]